MLTYRLGHVGIEGEEHVAQLARNLLVNPNTRRHLGGYSASRRCRRYCRRGWQRRCL